MSDGVIKKIIVVDMGGPSTIERAKRSYDEAMIREQGMSAASIIAMSAPPGYPGLGEAILSRDLRDLMKERERMEALTTEWVTIPYTGSLGPSERLIDPG